RGFPAAAVIEPDVKVFGIEPEQRDQRQYPASESGPALHCAGVHGLRPAFADPVTEAQLAAVLHQQHRLGELAVHLQRYKRLAEQFLGGHDAHLVRRVCSPSPRREGGWVAWSSGIPLCLQRRSSCLQKFLDGERLVEELDLLDCNSVVTPAEKQDLEVDPVRKHSHSQLAAAEARQAEVRHEEVDGALVLAGQRERFLSILCLKHQIAAGTQNKADQSPDRVVVLDHKDGLSRSTFHCRSSTKKTIYVNRGKRPKVDTISQILAFPRCPTSGKH